MKQKTIVLILLLIGLNANVFSQKENRLVCNSKSAQKNSPAVSNAELHTTKVYSGHECVRVKIHKITQTGLPPLNDVALQNKVNSLNNIFSIGNYTSITFVADTQIAEHNYDDVFSGDLVYLDPETNTYQVNFNNIIDINALDDPYALDLYFSNNDLGGGSTSYEIANKTIAFISVNNSSEIVSHEIGHVLGLFHTYHGTIGGGNNSIAENNDGFNNHEPECAHETNGYPNSGDYVEDTIGDVGPSAYSEDFNSCTTNKSDTIDHCNNTGPDTGINYPSIDLTNIMRTTQSLSSSCMENFTIGQLHRMVYFLNNELNDIVPDSCVANNDCIDCNQSQDLADQLFNNLSAGPPWNICRYSMAYPTNLTCEVNFGVTWNNQEEVILEDPSDVAFFTISGNQCVDITVYLKDGTLCNTYTYCIENVPAPCENEGCIDCNDVMQAIVSSLIVNYNSCPIAYLIIPDIDACYTGQINWGDSNTWYDLTSGSTMSHMLFGSSSSIQVTLTDVQTGNQCAYWRFPAISGTCKSNTNNIILIPNPIKPNQELQFDGIDSKDITKIEILDMLGNQKQFIQRTPTSVFIGNLKPGIYFVKFFTAKGIEQKKLIIK